MYDLVAGSPLGLSFYAPIGLRVTIWTTRGDDAKVRFADNRLIPKRVGRTPAVGRARLDAALAVVERGTGGGAREFVARRRSPPAPPLPQPGCRRIPRDALDVDRGTRVR